MKYKLMAICLIATLSVIAMQPAAAQYPSSQCAGGICQAPQHPQAHPPLQLQPAYIVQQSPHCQQSPQCQEAPLLVPVPDPRFSNCTPHGCYRPAPPAFHTGCSPGYPPGCRPCGPPAAWHAAHYSNYRRSVGLGVSLSWNSRQYCR